MRVLVTGGAGAIGSHVVERLLARGDRVTILDSFHDFYPRPIKERNIAELRHHVCFEGLRELDIREVSQVDGLIADLRPDGIVHLAARAGVRPSLEDPVGYVDCNLTGTASVLNAALAHGIERFVFASSSSVYGERPRGPFVEDVAADRPLSPYGATKRGGELLCHAAHHTHGLSVTCLRFFTVYGPRQRPDLAIHKFARLALAGRAIPVYGDGSAERDFTYVSDIVDGVVRALDRCSGYAIYNLGRGKPVTLADTIGALESALGVAIERETLPLQNGDVPRTWAAIERANAELGYEPRVELDDGIAAFVRWLRKEEGTCEPS
jgi:UDP-glucuronate 4-epimerase